ncbi:MAG: hypothetical protein HWE20_17355 [Gammaproteobacteria bacterium]|nr:hypothetical protein [Gammaproteobacteria bacterium]
MNIVNLLCTRLSRYRLLAWLAAALPVAGISMEYYLPEQPESAIAATLPLGDVTLASSYHVYQDQKITQGDILLPKAGLNARSAIFDNRSLWQNGIVPYVIAEGVSDGLRARLTDAIQHWHDATGLRFEAHTDTHNLGAFVAVYGADICASNIGKVGTVNYLLLSEFCSTGSIIHELGHTAGLLHEHMRSDRDAYIQINTENIRPQALHNFTETAPIGFRNFGDYDFDSIMHYTATAFSANGSPTITARYANVEFGQRDHLSALDRATVNLMYGSDIAIQATLSNQNSTLPTLTLTVHNQGPMGVNDIDLSMASTEGIAAPRFTAGSCAEQSKCVVPHLDAGEQIELIVRLYSRDMGTDHVKVTASSQVHDHDLSNNMHTLPVAINHISHPPMQNDELTSVAGGSLSGFTALVLSMLTLVTRQTRQRPQTKLPIITVGPLAALLMVLTGCEQGSTAIEIRDLQSDTASVSQDAITRNLWASTIPLEAADSIRLLKTTVRDRRGVHHNWDDVSERIDTNQATMSLPAFESDEEFLGEVYRLEADFDGYVIGRVLYQDQNTPKTLALEILPIHDLIYQSTRWTAQRTVSQIEDEKVDQMVNLGLSLIKRIDSIWRTLTLGKTHAYTPFDADAAKLIDFNKPIVLSHYAERVHKQQDRGPIVTELLSMHSYVPDRRLDDILQIGKQVILSNQSACTWLTQRYQSGFFNISDQDLCLDPADLIVHNHNAIVLRVQPNVLQLYTLSNERLIYEDRLTLDVPILDVAAYDSGFAILGDDKVLYYYRTDGAKFESIDSIAVKFGPVGLQVFDNQLMVYGVQNHLYHLQDNLLVHQKKLLTKGIVAQGGVSGKDFVILHGKTRLLVYRQAADGLLAYTEHLTWAPIYFSPPRSDLTLDDVVLIDDQLHGIFSWAFHTGDGTPSARHYYDTAHVIHDDSGLHVDTAYTPVKIGDRKNNAKLKMVGTTLMMVHSDGPPISLGTNFIEVLESAHKFNYLTDIELFDTNAAKNSAVALGKVPGQVDAYLRDNLYIVEGHDRLYYYYAPLEDSAVYQVDQGIDWMGKVGDQYWLTSMDGRLIRLTHDSDNQQFIETHNTTTKPIESAASGDHFVAWNLYGSGLHLSALEADTPQNATIALDMDNISHYKVHRNQIAVGGLGELAVWEIAPDLEPTLRYRANTASVIDDIVWLDDNTIAYTDGALGVKVLSIDGQSVQTLSSIETYSTVRQLAYADGYLALADESNTLLVYDLKDPSKPQNIGVLALVPEIKSIAFNQVPVPGTDLVNPYLQLSLSGSTLYQLFVPQRQLACDGLAALEDGRRHCRVN